MKLHGNAARQQSFQLIRLRDFFFKSRRPFIPELDIQMKQFQRHAKLARNQHDRNACIRNAKRIFLRLALVPTLWGSLWNNKESWWNFWEAFETAGVRY